MRRRGTGHAPSALVLLGAVALVAVADGQTGCPSAPEFEACVADATLLYNSAVTDLEPQSSCYKARACEFIKDVYACVRSSDCCEEQVEARIEELESQIRPLGVFQVCDAINMCATNAPEKELPTGCCPLEPGATASKRVCCRSADCSLCSKTTGGFTLGDKVVQYTQTPLRTPTHTYTRLRTRTRTYTHAYACHTYARHAYTRVGMACVCSPHTYSCNVPHKIRVTALPLADYGSLWRILHPRDPYLPAAIHTVLLLVRLKLFS